MKNMEESVELHRRLLKSHPLWKIKDELQTAQKQGVPKPEIQKPCPPDSTLVDLVPIDQCNLGQIPLITALQRRQSRRAFTEQVFTIEELSFLLWVAQGVNRKPIKAGIPRRTAPSGASSYPIETYLLVKQGRVLGIDAGLYRYLPLEHKLCTIKKKV